MIGALKVKILTLLKNNYGICIKPLHQIRINHKQFRVIKGTINKQPDYDGAWCLALALHSKIVYDVGANIGQNAILILYSQTIQKIVLIDANPEALSMAAENLILNNISQNAIFIPAFASNKSDGTMKFWTIGAGAAGSMFSTHAKSAKEAGSYYYVPNITLDYLSEYYGFFPDYVKIDVEGAEYLVLEGSKKIASQRNCKFLVEMHSSPELPMKTNATRILNWCDENDYCAWYLKEHTILKSLKQIQNRGRCHLLLLPSNNQFPSYLEGISQSAPLTEV